MGAIEIKELHIKINVDNETKPTAGTMKTGIDRQQLIAECVEQVMDIIDNQKER
ncbi:DUF5908 family protein [Aquimarina hainanensis]|uniref:DUF5908 family protein n=1 Tax=Aquimarina hainanensis TaxID=1578017 RepID=A0ABW5NDN5_9FLAO|nr:DUF5908 family protein [Aquimarina sp. TRL1]QKX07313.1 hypothetical protein HN014_21160 [Aquimarina sp. TRL1]